MKTLNNQEQEKKTSVNLTFADFADNNLMRKKMRKIMKPDETGTSAKERLLILKYLIEPRMNNYMTIINHIVLLDKLCDLDKSTIKSASKDINKDYWGYTADVYLKKLQEIKDLFIGIRPDSYNEKDPEDRHNYCFVNEIISRIDKDIEEAGDLKKKKRN